MNSAVDFLKQSASLAFAIAPYLATQVVDFAIAQASDCSRHGSNHHDFRRRGRARIIQLDSLVKTNGYAEGASYTWPSDSWLPGCLGKRKFHAHDRHGHWDDIHPGADEPPVACDLSSSVCWSRRGLRLGP